MTLIPHKLPRKAAVALTIALALCARPARADGSADSAESAAASSEPAPKPPVEWNCPRATVRYFVTAQNPNDSVLVFIPSKTPAGKPVADVVVEGATGELPFDVVAVTDDSVALQIANGSSIGFLVIYAVPGEDGRIVAETPAESRRATDKTPVGGMIARVRGHSMPSTLEEVYENKNASVSANPNNLVQASSYATISTQLKEFADSRNSWGDISVTDSFSWIMIDKDGAYEFAAGECEGLAFLFIDDDPAPAASYIKQMAAPKDIIDPAPGAAPQSAQGSGVAYAGTRELKRGLHFVRMLQVAQYVNISPQIKKPGEASFAPIMSESVSSRPFVQALVPNYVDSIVHAAFSWDVVSSFACNGKLFHLVLLCSQAQDWSGKPISDSWELINDASGNRLSFAGASKIMPLEPGMWRVNIASTNALGFSSATGGDISIAAQRYVDECDLDSSLTGLPSIVHETDSVDASIEFRGNIPSVAPIAVTARVIGRGQDPSGEPARTISGEVSMSRGWGRMHLGYIDIAATDRIEWSAAISGVEVERGAANIQHRPYKRFPSAIRRDGLMHDGELIAYAISGTSSRDPRRDMAHFANSVVILEDSINMSRDAYSTNVSFAGSFTAALSRRGLEPSLVSLDNVFHDPGNSLASLGIFKAAGAALESCSSNSMLVLAVSNPFAFETSSAKEVAERLGLIAAIWTDITGKFSVLCEPFFMDDAALRKRASKELIAARDIGDDTLFASGIPSPTSEAALMFLNAMPRDQRLVRRAQDNADAIIRCLESAGMQMRTEQPPLE